MVAKKSSAIVASLFPSNVRDRLLEDAEAQAAAELDKKKRFKPSSYLMEAHQKEQLKNFMHEEESNMVLQPYSTKPIADLFPSATVMFADIVGFWAMAFMFFVTMRP